MKLKNLFYATSGIILLSASSAMAAALPVATPGTLGDTDTPSAGTISMKMTVLEEVLVNNLDSFLIDNSGTGATGIFTPDGTIDQGGDSFCIYYNNSPNVTVTLTSANGAFELLEDGVGTDTIPYSVNIDDSPSTGGTYSPVTYNNPTNLAGARQTNDSCNAADTYALNTTAISVTINGSAVAGGLAVNNGEYLDTITVSVVPNP